MWHSLALQKLSVQKYHSAPSASGSNTHVTEVTKPQAQIHHPCQINGLLQRNFGQSRTQATL